jgi:hypothetical protein
MRVESDERRAKRDVRSLFAPHSPLPTPLRWHRVSTFIATMGATLIESPDEHHWVLLDHQVTQIVIDASCFRIQTWSLEGSAEIRCSAPFTLRQASGSERAIDPTETETLAPLLALLRRRVESLTITRDGELTAAFSGGSSIVVGPPRASASGARRSTSWELQGGGALEGMSYAGALPQPHGHE